MKELSLLVWLTQLGISIAAPLIGFILLALWLRDSCGWGDWVIVAGVVVGIASAIEGLRSSLKAMKLLSRRKKDPPPPPIAFNDHH